MKTKLLLAAALLMLSVSAFAANKNMSLEYGRTMSRNASTEVDAAFFNPAGLAFIGEDGLYFEAANGTILQDRITETDEFKGISGTDKYPGEIRAWIYPVIAAAYKMGNLTPFFHFAPIGGGAGGYFPEGTPYYYSLIAGYGDACDITFNGSQMKLGFTGGTAYRISNMISVAAGYRYSYYSAEYKGEVKNLIAGGAGNGNLEYSYKEEGFGHTFILGMDVQPGDRLNFGIKMEWSPVWKKEQKDTEIKADYGVASAAVEATFAALLPGDGTKTNNQEPLSLYTGASYKITDALKATASVIWEMHTKNNLTDDEEKDMHDNIFSSCSLEYIFSEALLASMGYAYETGKNEAENIDSIDMGLPAHHFAFGGAWKIGDRWELGAGYTYSYYVPRRDDNGWKYYYDYSHQLFVGVKYGM